MMNKICKNILKGILLLVNMLIVQVAHADHGQYESMDLADLVEVDIFTPTVFTAHIHKKNEVMLGYSFMHMDMRGLRDGNSNLDVQDVFNEGFMVSPLNMTTDMHMFHLMYAPTNNLTLMAMTSYLIKKMDLRHVNPTLGDFSTKSEGFGDIKLNANYVFHRNITNYGESDFVATLGLSFPTGSINNKDTTAMSPNNEVLLGYPMQLGSGTYDPTVGLSWLAYANKWYWGAQVLDTFRIGRNYRGYALGNRFDLKVWVDRAITDYFSLFLRLDGLILNNIKGKDDQLNAAMSPTNDPGKFGKKRINGTIGVDLHASRGLLENNHITFEVSKPLYQRLNGPQLKLDWALAVRWQYVFRAF